MKRVAVDERPDWRRRVESQGLAYAVEQRADGTVAPYWHEAHAYELDVDEADHLEAVTRDLHEMSLQAAWHLLESAPLWASLGLPDAARDLVRHSLAGERDRTLYGRFDLAWDGLGPAKLLEYNADTPAGLVEAAVCQWMWLEELRPENDQWNLLHEWLVATWARLGGTAPGGRVHLAVGASEPNEDWCTVAYLSDTAAEAGLNPVQLTMEEVGWDSRREVFVGAHDDDVITTIFAMYPWEWMLTEPFGQHLLRGGMTRWIEPVWKVLLGSKTLLVALWECYPGHDLLLPATLDEPGPWPGYVAKPVFGWEGAGIEVVTPQLRHRQPPGHTGGQRQVFQQYHALPAFDGARPVLGTWVIGGHAAGLGIRESDGPVTDTGARFLPHYLNGPRSTPEQIRAWLGDE